MWVSPRRPRCQRSTSFVALPLAREGRGPHLGSAPIHEAHRSGWTTTSQTLRAGRSRRRTVVIDSKTDVKRMCLTPVIRHTECWH